MNLIGVAASAAGEFRTAQLRNLYRHDFQAWKADVLGFRTYKMMQDITNEALFGEIPRTMIKSSNGTSKDLALDTPILTLGGWKTMGTVEVGDYVFSEEGKPIPVVWKSEVFHRPSYRVTFDDGAYLVGSDSHEWNTLTLSERGKGAADWRDKWDDASTRTTAEIADTLLNKTGSSRNHLIPLARPVEFPEADLPLDPYVLGVWLGDGTAMRAEITCHPQDEYVIRNVEKAGYPMRRRSGSPYSWVAELDGTPAGKQNSPSSRLYATLLGLGVVKNKHIPEHYLHSSVDQRISLVRGLMDTDGWADTRGSAVGWGQSDERLVGQFCDLLSSLGVRFSLTASQPPIGKLAYTVKFTPDFDPFTQGERKSKVFRSGSKTQRSRMTGRTIVSVERVQSVPTQCIQVDSERHLYLAGSYLVPTHNSFEVANMILWVGAVHEPGEAVSIVSAPSLNQVEKTIFKYMKSGSARAQERGRPLPGWINESLEWKYQGPAGQIDLAFGRKPPAGKEVNVFQGIRSEHGMTYVFFDEAGGLSRGMWTAAEAVLTGADARLITIGNPDDVGTDWYRQFTDKKFEGEFNRFTISSFDLPTFTGEVVYPDDPDMQERMMKSLTQVSWVEHKKRVWGETDARYLSKVKGEFPKDGGFGFFPSSAIHRAYDTDIELDLSRPLVMGVDIARWGKDESVVAFNRGGRIRVEETWGQCDTVESARRIHRIANENRAVEVRIDAGGIGGAVYDMLVKLEEFDRKTYVLIGVDNASKSPDLKQWSNKRAYNHDSLRTQMMKGEIDLDIEDSELRDELDIITYRFTSQGGVQITPKDDMKNELGGSPDRLDAVILSATDLTPWLNNPLNTLAPGEKVMKTPEEIMGYSYAWGAPGTPM